MRLKNHMYFDRKKIVLFIFKLKLLDLCTRTLVCICEKKKYFSHLNHYFESNF